jgi:hypothetical protein
MNDKTYADMEISRIRTNTVKTLYAVHHMGEVLVASSGDPEHDACRAYEGTATHIRFFWKDTGRHGLTMPVAWGREHYTQETKRFGPATREWKPNSWFSQRRKDGDL